MENTEQMQAYIQQAIDLGVPLGLNILKVIFIFLIGKWIGGKLSQLAVAGMSRAKVDQTISEFGGTAVRYLILAVTILAVLNVFGFETTSLVAVLGAAGFAVGLAMQGTLSNFSAGVMLLLFRPFSVGDVIDAGGVGGRVKRLEIFATVLENARGDQITVPNGQIYGATITNLSPLGDKMRLDLDFGIEYGADIDTAAKVLIDTANGLEGVLADEGTTCPVVGLGASSVDLQVRAWVDPADYWGVWVALHRAGKYALDAAGIGIPYQTIDLNITSAPDSLALKA